MIVVCALWKWILVFKPLTLMEFPRPLSTWTLQNFQFPLWWGSGYFQETQCLGIFPLHFSDPGQKCLPTFPHLKDEDLKGNLKKVTERTEEECPPNIKNRTRTMVWVDLLYRRCKISDWVNKELFSFNACKSLTPTQNKNLLDLLQL